MDYNHDVKGVIVRSFEEYLEHLEKWEDLQTEAKILLLEIIKKLIQQKIDELKGDKSND